MMMRRIRLGLSVGVALMTIGATGASVRAHSQTDRDERRWAIIVRGVAGSREYERQFSAWSRALYTILRERMALGADDIYYLTAETPPPTDITVNVDRATGDAVARVFAEINKKVTEKDLIVVFLIGHGGYDGERATFNLVGRDWSADDFARMVSQLKTRNVVFINTASASGEFIRPLGKTGAVVITATRSGREQNATIFAEHFIAALSDDRADFDKNGRTSVLEAFSYAAKATADWYARQGLLATEHPLLDDNGDGIGHSDATEGDGAVARHLYLDSVTARLPSDDPELRALARRKEELERAIESLKARKAQMPAEEYERELERLAVELAEVNQAMRRKRK